MELVNKTSKKQGVHFFMESNKNITAIRLLSLTVLYIKIALKTS